MNECGDCVYGLCTAFSLATKVLVELVEAYRYVIVMRVRYKLFKNVCANKTTKSLCGTYEV